LILENASAFLRAVLIQGSLFNVLREAREVRGAGVAEEDLISPRGFAACMQPKINEQYSQANRHFIAIEPKSKTRKCKHEKILNAHNYLFTDAFVSMRRK
jgi:hypothetical protein